MLPALVIVGMHRSATSLVTSILGSAGLAIGDRLAAGGLGNPDGHFEDLDFVSLHERVLRANGLGSEGYTTVERIAMPASLETEARAIIDGRRNAGKAWGWKDPRTALFLDFWLAMLPEAGFLMLVRPPWEVVDSLYRRGDESFHLHPAFAIDVWVAYNRRIRDFLLAHRDRCLVVESGRAVADGAGLVVAVRDTLGIPLGEPEPLAKPQLFRTAEGSRRRDLLGAACPAAIALHEELLALAWRSGDRPLPPIDTTISLQLAMGEWARAARAEAAAADLRRTLAAASADRDAARHEAEQFRARTESAAADLQSCLAAACGERDRIREELDQVRSAGSTRRVTMAIGESNAATRKSVPQKIVRESRRLCRQVREWSRWLAPSRPHRSSTDETTLRDAA